MKKTATVNYFSNKAKLKKHEFLSFEEARSIVHTLKIVNKETYVIWAKTMYKPEDIPANPAQTYKKKGWMGWGDWLGTGRVANQDREYLPFEQARVFIRTLKIVNKEAYVIWAKTPEKPNNIPANPAGVYKGNGWVGWGDWLGTGRVANQDREYLPFEQARAFVRTLELRGGKEWNTWTKTSEKPKNIPTNPAEKYKDNGWKGMGDWLGTGAVASQDREYRSFEQARVFIRTLKIVNRDAYVIWTKTVYKPEDIPANPAQTYKKKGWMGWGDWLGTGRVANQDREYRPFEQARAFVHSYKLRSTQEWRAWAKTSDKPEDIPSDPVGKYKESGWKSWGDWLGTNRIANQDREYRSFEQARTFIHTLKILNGDAYAIWAKTLDKPEDIPANPAQTYKNAGWKGMGDWLGTGVVSTRDRKYLPFEQARAFVRTLELRGSKEWNTWTKTSNKPENIPTNPAEKYKDNGWKGMGDWLGTGAVASQDREFLSFEQARVFIRALKIVNKDAYVIWAKTLERPENIPANPARTYKDKWGGWGDWLGSFLLWNKNAVLSFLKSIEPVLSTLAPIELLAIMRKNGMLGVLTRETEISGILQSLKDICSSGDHQAAFQQLVSQLESVQQDASNLSEYDDIDIPKEVEITSILPGEDLPVLNEEKSLDDVDHLVGAGLISDEETIEFLICNRVSALWQKVLNKNDSVNLKELRVKKGGVYFESIKNRFFSQYDGAQALSVPQGYSFKIAGKIVEPNLMQKLTAYRLMSENRIGNWSGVGAGKTISAILASRVIAAELTVIIAFNSTIDGWQKVINEVFQNSKVHVKETGNIVLDNTRPNYVLLNFEKFQQVDSVKLVQKMIQDHKIDFIVLDEIQNVKQRNPNAESKRRKLVKILLHQVSEKNPNLHVLGMSATPVINNLYEGKALLEMVKGVEFNELKTTSTIANASALHEKLILHGIRYRPQYSQKIVTKYPIIDGQESLPRLYQASNEGILAIEQILLEAKFSSILSFIKSGTLIYSHYKTKIVPFLERAVRSAGFSTGLFTGDDKEGLASFISKKVDVLIGTSPIGTGVDGLQFVCNRLIIVSLPWTAAEYEQLIGRLYRQGSNFSEVEVFIPQVILMHNGAEWSWDKLRMRRIQFKKTLADAALDGVIPEGNLESGQSMFDKARESLHAWIDRIQENGVFFIEREKWRIPLDEQDIVQGIRSCGDFTTMNARINSSNSSTTHDRFNINPAEWYLYHSLYRKARENWPEVPCQVIAEALKQRPDWVIGDFGCGEAQLAEFLPNKVYSFDHIAINEQVTPCDLKLVPLQNEFLDVVVFSLSLMGLNYSEYLKEAYRVLRFGGLLKIAEPSGRWVDSTGELIQSLRAVGFQILGEVSRSDQFLYINASKL